MKKNTWGEVLMKMMAIGLVIVGLHKHQLIVSSLENLDISYLTSFKNLNMKDVVNDPLHLVTYDDSASLLVHQVIFNNQTLETDGTLNEEKKSIYIYNTHQYENYENGGVMDGALYLKKKLEDLGYEVIFETNDFEAYKRNNNMDLTETYPTSRIFLEKQLESHGPFDLIIDFHRDSVSKEASTLIADGKSFAKMMMVISLSSKNYETVEANSIEIHAAAEKIQPGIMRADFKREYAYYNQQYAPSMILIEVGAQYNSYEEVTRSIDVLASAIDTCFKGEKNQMKNLLLDICLVLLILLIGSNILNPQTLNQETFNTNIENFNEDVKTSMLDSHYQLSKDPYPNRVSEFVEGVSDLSRDGIRVVVETFVKAFHGF